MRDVRRTGRRRVWAIFCVVNLSGRGAEGVCSVNRALHGMRRSVFASSLREWSAG